MHWKIFVNVSTGLVSIMGLIIDECICVLRIFCMSNQGFVAFSQMTVVEGFD